MTPTGSNNTNKRIENIRIRFGVKSVLAEKISKSDLGKHRSEVLQQDINDLKVEAKKGNLDGMLALEITHQQEELNRFSGSPGHKSSLEQGIKDISDIQDFLPKIRDPDRYKVIDESHVRSSSRRNGLPDDDARKCFRAHKTRLGNIDRSRMDDAERMVLDQRRLNLGLAEKIYIELQEKRRLKT